jgi:hypothetical protein
MRDDATCWINLGDSYASQPSWGRGGGSTLDGGVPYSAGIERDLTSLKPKDLIGVPWRVAFALQADGWWLRSAIVWHKPNCMPESVRDRPTTDYELVFLLAKSARYFYDADAIREPILEESKIRDNYKHAGPSCWNTSAVPFTGGDVSDSVRTNPAGRNKRPVWTISTCPYSEAHFATFPPALVEPMLLAGTSARGCCPACGAAWERVVEKERTKDPTRHTGRAAVGNNDRQDGDWPRMITTSETTGWLPTCDCCNLPGDVSIEMAGLAPVPCTVLDPFGGAGTVGLVAARHNRDAILIELNPGYALMAYDRIKDDMPLFTNVDVIDDEKEVPA